MSTSGTAAGNPIPTRIRRMVDEPSRHVLSETDVMPAGTTLPPFYVEEDDIERRTLLRLQEAGEERVERHATWTELFFDLVFVAAVAQLAAGLHADASLDGAIGFVGLFAPCGDMDQLRVRRRPLRRGRGAVPAGAARGDALRRRPGGDHTRCLRRGDRGLRGCVRPAAGRPAAGLRLGVVDRPAPAAPRG